MNTQITDIIEDREKLTITIARSDGTSRVYTRRYWFNKHRLNPAWGYVNTRYTERDDRPKGQSWAYGDMRHTTKPRWFHWVRGVSVMAKIG